MALSEDQILRYSRQILLSAVGGAGQERLLNTTVSLTGHGSAQSVAAGYLAAAGIFVEPAAGTLPLNERAFGFPLEDRKEADPRVGAVTELRGQLGEMPASFTGEPPWVAIGWEGLRSVVLFCTKKGCADCFALSVHALGPGPSDETSVPAGALAALALQRMVLRLGPELGGLSMAPDGKNAPFEIQRCVRCLAAS